MYCEYLIEKPYEFLLWEKCASVWTINEFVWHNLKWQQNEKLISGPEDPYLHWIQIHSFSLHVSVSLMCADITWLSVTRVFTCLRVMWTSWEHVHVSWSSQVTDPDKSILGQRHYTIIGSHTDPIHSFSPLCVQLTSWLKGRALIARSRKLKTPLWEYFVPRRVCVCHVCSLTDRCRVSVTPRFWQHKVKRVKTTNHETCSAVFMLLAAICVNTYENEEVGGRGAWCSSLCVSVLCMEAGQPEWILKLRLIIISNMRVSSSQLSEN